MARRLLAPALALTLAAAWLLVTAAPAMAACHIAAFVEGDAEAAPGSAVTLVVELQGRVASCAGTVDVATVDGTAVAGTDYEAVSQTLTFEEGDDREEAVEVAVLDGATAGAAFTVELSNPTGSLSGTGSPATVTIAGGAGEDAPDDEASLDPDAPREPDVVLPDEEGGSLGIVLAVVGALVVGIGAFVVLRGRG